MFLLEKERNFPGAHKSGSAISGPRIAGKTFYRHEENVLKSAESTRNNKDVPWFEKTKENQNTKERKIRVWKLRESAPGSASKSAHEIGSSPGSALDLKSNFTKQISQRTSASMATQRHLDIHRLPILLKQVMFPA